MVVGIHEGGETRLRLFTAKGGEGRRLFGEDGTTG